MLPEAEKTQHTTHLRRVSLYFYAFLYELFHKYKKKNDCVIQLNCLFYSEHARGTKIRQFNDLLNHVKNDRTCISDLL